ncbi:MAG: hypothetical protein ABSG31_13570 [Tepidisphaeraceae bacterium]|jgi:hypothetical protein
MDETSGQLAIIPAAPSHVDIPASRLKSRTCLLLVCLAAVTAFLPAMLGNYGYRDDYSELLETIQGAKWIVSGTSSFGRPLQGLLIETTFTWARTIENLVFIRIFIVAQILALAWLIFRHLLRYTASPIFSATATIFIITLPTFAFVAGFASGVAVVLPALLSYPAYLLIIGVENWRSPMAWLRVTLGILLLIAGLFTYQPPVLFCCFWFLVATLFGTWDARTMLRKMILLMASVGVAGALYMIGVKKFCPPAPRMDVNHDFLQKARWFFGYVIPNTFRFHLIEANYTIGIISIIGIALTILVFSHESRPVFWTKVLVIGVMIPMSYLASLVAAESYSTYRTRTTLMPCAALLMWYGLWLIGRSAEPMLRKVGWTAMIALACVAPFKAAYIDYEYLVFPQSVEYAIARSQLVSFDRSRQSTINLISPDASDIWFSTDNFQWCYFDEFCSPTTLTPDDWGMGRSLIALALYREHPEAYKTGVIVNCFPANADPPVDPSTVTVDMRMIRLFK